MELILTARLGRHVVKDAFEKLGFTHLTQHAFKEIFEAFLELAGTKKEVYNHDLYILIEKYYSKHQEPTQEITYYKEQFFELLDLQVISNTNFPSASVKIKHGEEILEGSASGSGSIDALYSAITNLISFEIKLKEYNINSVSKGKEALGKVKVDVEYDGESYIAKATDTDIIKASALAYINAINSILVDQLIPVK